MTVSANSSGGVGIASLPYWFKAGQSRQLLYMCMYSVSITLLIPQLLYSLLLFLYNVHTCNTLSIAVFDVVFAFINPSSFPLSLYLLPPFPSPHPSSSSFHSAPSLPLISPYPLLFPLPSLPSIQRDHPMLPLRQNTLTTGIMRQSQLV